MEDYRGWIELALHGAYNYKLWGKASDQPMNHTFIKIKKIALLKISQNHKRGKEIKPYRDILATQGTYRTTSA